MVEDVVYSLPHLDLRGLFWRKDQLSEQKKLFLGIHGWVDNAASFQDLFSNLSEPALALDLAGHGQSDHRPLGASYALPEYAVDLHVLLRELDLHHVTLVGHSMGTAVAALLAALNPDRIEKLIFIDGFGPLTEPPENWSTSFVKAIHHRTESRRFQKNYLFHNKKFKSLGAAISARQNSQYQILDPVRAEQLLLRNIVPQNGDLGSAPITLSYDPRITHPSSHRLTELQVKSLFEFLTQPVLALFGEDGYFKEEPPKERISWVKKIKTVWLPGDHYLHLGVHAGKVFDEIARF